MPKKPVRKKATSSKRKVIRIKGAVGFGVLLLVVLIIGFSITLVVGGKYSTTSQQALNEYKCCDSQNGGDTNCTPIANEKLFINNFTTQANSYGQQFLINDEYQLLKSGAYLTELGQHLLPITDANVEVSKNGQPRQPIDLAYPTHHVYYSDSDGSYVLLDNPDGTQRRQIYTCDRPEFGDSNGNPIEWRDYIVSEPPNPPGCTSIPNDQLLYVCVNNCDDGTGNPSIVGGDATFNVYFRARDLIIPPGEGISNSIKNCTKPAIPSTGGQTIVTPVDTTNDKNLKLKTFNVVNDPTRLPWVSPYCKPAVYLYPEEQMFVHVLLDPKGEITYTDPLYPEGGWKVWAYPSGDILSDYKRYDYLYYEAEVPQDSYALPEEGFVVAKDSLPTFLPELVTKLGLNHKETQEFTEYWVGVLPDSAYYQVKIVKQEVLDDISPLYITPRPSTVIRVTLHFKALDEAVSITAPEIAPVTRDGFTVVEWGGLFERTGEHEFSCFM